MASILKVDKIRVTGSDSDAISFDGNSVATFNNPPTLSTGAMTNAPAFHAYHTTVANQAGVLTGLNNENSFIYKGDLTSINTNTVYNTSNGRFTPGVAGKYWCYATMSPASATSGFERTIVRFLKNGTKYPASTSEFDTSFSQDTAEPTFLPCHISMIVDLSATDYLECQVFHDCESVFWEFKSNNCHFGGYKLIGL